jgi:hypothetical protein
MQEEETQKVVVHASGCACDGRQKGYVCIVRVLFGVSRVSCALDLTRVCEAPFLDRPGRLPLWQGSKREEAGLP